MSSNKSARQELERIYGKGCMFKRAGIEKRIELLGKIKTYKKFVEQTRYKRSKIKQLEKNLTYHHIKHRSEGGETNEENGAELSELAHQYIHSLPRNQEELINDMLQEFKLEIKGGIMLTTNKGIDLDPFSLTFEDMFNDDSMTIELESVTPELLEKREKYNRAKMKRELKQKIQDSLDEDLEY